ncbi:MAG: hypothetical protein AABO57_24280 [Acidobacteriota bacterium]
MATATHGLGSLGLLSKLMSAGQLIVQGLATGLVTMASAVELLSAGLVSSVGGSLTAMETMAVLEMTVSFGVPAVT